MALEPYQQILADAGYPTQVAVLDFETFFDTGYSLTAMSHAEYVADPRFAVLGVSVKWLGGLPADFYFGAEDVQRLLQALDYERLVISCHNAPFDAFILAHKYGIYPPYLVDTLDLARAWNVTADNSVKGLAERYGVHKKGETARFKGLTEANATPEQIEQLSEYARTDAEIQASVFAPLLERLSNPTTELRIMQATIEMWTKPTLGCDQRLGTILAKAMKDEATAAIKRLGCDVKDISNEKRFVEVLSAALRDAGSDVAPYLKLTKRGEVFALAQDDEQREILLNHHSQRVSDLCEAKVGRRSWPGHIARVNRICGIARICDGRLPVPLHYCGAHTGRDSGGESINLQNLARQGSPLIVAIRNLLTATPGYRLLRIDLNAIEARVVAWLAGERELVAAFASGTDVYIDFASDALREKIVPEDSAPVESKEHMAWARQSVGKVGVLGCGFGMGARLPANREMPNVMFLKNKLSVEIADTIVNTFRRKYANIVKFWYELETAFKRTATKGIPSEVGFITFLRRPDCNVVARLPSGRELHYHEVRLKDVVTCTDDGRSNWRRQVIQIRNPQTGSWKSVWGGALCENVTQAVARDVLMEGALNVEANLIHVAHRVHDEIICMCPIDNVYSDKETASKILCTPPVWAPGLPLAGKAKIVWRYSK